MVLCRFFQQGSCRYGTKCNNEHFDVKVYLKADMESAINGKMWPFSAYGPFKDKANFPNFIEDQSFDEVRFMCYEAKRQNTFEQFHQQFNREVQEATNKMKAMLQLSPQILDTMIKIYESAEGASVTSAPQQSNNLFATAGAAPNASASLFGKPTLTTGNIFGAATGQVNNASSIFGGSMATGNTGTSIFGGPAAAAPAPNVFGQPQQQQPPQAATQAFQGGNIFAQAAAQAQVQPVNPNPFGSYPAAGGLFAQAANPNPGGLFGQAAQQQQQPQQPPSGLFSQAAGFPNQQQQLQQQQLQMQQQQQQLMMQQQQMLQQQEQHQHQQAANATPSLAYSKMEELTADEIEAFKSDQFLPGHLPFKPPPRELC
ncbi:uncharacterized protein [Drosophila kikkawai]|uniref:Nucleoporin NUP42 n=1 Tax=Drosophila kikkawai TaxID=30033 RepID=A0A6P4I6V2_DROKI|nr:ras-interacting protein RIP3 [Drosophila kikkawai]